MLPVFSRRGPLSEVEARPRRPLAPWRSRDATPHVLLVAPRSSAFPSATGRTPATEEAPASDLTQAAAWDRERWRVEARSEPDRSGEEAVPAARCFPREGKKPSTSCSPTSRRVREEVGEPPPRSRLAACSRGEARGSACAGGGFPRSAVRHDARRGAQARCQSEAVEPPQCCGQAADAEVDVLRTQALRPQRLASGRQAA